MLNYDEWLNLNGENLDQEFMETGMYYELDSTMEDFYLQRYAIYCLEYN